MFVDPPFLAQRGFSFFESELGIVFGVQFSVTIIKHLQNQSHPPTAQSIKHQRPASPCAGENLQLTRNIREFDWVGIIWKESERHSQRYREWYVPRRGKRE